jgi:hypothetical protein
MSERSKKNAVALMTQHVELVGINRQFVTLTTASYVKIIIIIIIIIIITNSELCQNEARRTQLH